jgi:opacity protein-like surface antigen
MGTILTFKIWNAAKSFLILGVQYPVYKEKLKSSSMRNRCLHFSKKLIVYFFLTTLLSPSIANSQGNLGFGKPRYEVGFEIGPSVFLGDLGGHRGKGTYFIKDWNFPVTKIMVGVFAAVYPSEWLGFRIAGNITQLTGDDEYINTDGKWELTRKVRDIEFRSNIQEVHVAMELYPTVLTNMKYDYVPRMRPYGVIGLGYFHFNPQSPYTNPSTGVTTWIDLKPLRLEGQGIIAGRKEYELNQFMIPMGAGVKYDVTDRLVVNLEVLHRKTFTDYIDDVSIRYADINQIRPFLTPEQETQARFILGQGITNLQFRSPYGPGRRRGNPKRNDAYFAFTAKIAYKIGSIYNSIFQNNLNKVRCPSYRF